MTSAPDIVSSIRRRLRLVLIEQITPGVARDCTLLGIASNEITTLRARIAKLEGAVGVMADVVNAADSWSVLVAAHVRWQPEYLVEIRAKMLEAHAVGSKIISDLHKVKANPIASAALAKARNPTPQSPGGINAELDI